MFNALKLLVYPAESMRKADTAANPIPVAAVRAISMMSLFLLKYWPTIRVAGSLVIATPKPVNGTFLLDTEEKRNHCTQHTQRKTTK